MSSSILCCCAPLHPLALLYMLGFVKKNKPFPTRGEAVHAQRRSVLHSGACTAGCLQSPVLHVAAAALGAVFNCAALEQGLGLCQLELRRANRSGAAL